MAAFLIDANLPRSLCRLLTSTGVVACDVRDVGLTDGPDHDIAAYASARGYVIVTRDVRFGAELYLSGQPFPESSWCDTPTWSV